MLEEDVDVEGVDVTAVQHLSLQKEDVVPGTGHLAVLADDIPQPHRPHLLQLLGCQAARLPAVRVEKPEIFGFELFSYFSFQVESHLSPSLSRLNCSALMQLKVGPVRPPWTGRSPRPPANRSISSGER